MEKTLVFALSSSIELAKEIVAELGLPLGECEVKHFADGEIMVELGQSVRGKHVYIVQSTCNPVSTNLMEVLIAIDACKRASAAHITVIMPYFGYARQDRKARPRQPITSKLVASLLETAGANRVITMELHATQIQGFFDIPADDISAMSIIGNYFRSLDLENIVVVSPDHGGVQMLRDKGAKAIYACCVHAVLSDPAIERLQAADLAGFICTNTIDQSEKLKCYDRMKVLSVGPVLGGVIRAMEHDRPVSEVLAIFAK